MTFDEAGKLAVAGDPAARLYWAALAIITTLPGYSDKTPDVAHTAAQKTAALMYAGDCFVSQDAPTDDPTIEEEYGSRKSCDALNQGGPVASSRKAEGTEP